MADQIGVYHLADDPDSYEVQRSNNFDFIIAFDDVFNRAGDSAGLRSKINGIKASDVIRMSVVKAQIPNFTQSAIEIKRGNDTMKVAGVPTFDAGRLVINDYIGADGKSVLMAWQAQSYHVDTQKVGAMKEYKHNCTLIEYSPDYKEVRYWDLHGCWISGIDEGEFDAESNNKQQLTATIQYDYAVMHLPDEEKIV